MILMKNSFTDGNIFSTVFMVGNFKGPVLWTVPVFWVQMISLKNFGWEKEALLQIVFALVEDIMGNNESTEYLNAALSQCLYNSVGGNIYLFIYLGTLSCPAD